MENNQNITTSPDFSDIPALGDSKGLETFLHNEALVQQGITPVEEQPAAQPAQPTVQVTGQPTAQPAQPAQPAAQPATPPTSGDSVTLTREQYNALLAGKQQPAQPQVQQPAARPAVYTAQEQAFITKALAQGYSLDQINRYLATQKSGQGRDPIMEQRIAQVEQYLKQQEYKTAETAFINRLSDFGSRWGLSEQDLVTFGQEAYKYGINIAQENVDLEMVFRAVYPEQYAIRSRRMTPTPSSQIYGGTSVPEASRASAAKIEDAYVEAFLKGAMPNQYGMLNKK